MTTVISTDLHMTEDLTERTYRTDLKITKTVKNC